MLGSTLYARDDAGRGNLLESLIKSPLQISHRQFARRDGWKGLRQFKLATAAECAQRRQGA